MFLITAFLLFILDPTLLTGLVAGIVSIINSFTGGGTTP